MHRLIQLSGYVLMAVGFFGTVRTLGARHDQTMSSINRTAKAVDTVRAEVHSTTAAVKQNTAEIKQVRKATQEVVQGAIDQHKLDAAVVKQLRIDAKLPPAVVVKNVEAAHHYTTAQKIIAGKGR